MDRHTPAGPAAVLEQLVDEFPDHAQRGRAALEVLREEADTAVLDLAAQMPGAERNAIGDAGGVDNGHAHVDGQGVGDADHVVAAVEGEAVGGFICVERVADDLHDG